MMYTIDIELTEESFKNKCLAYDFDPGELWEDLTVSITRHCNDEGALSKLPELLGMIFEWKVVSVKSQSNDSKITDMNFVTHRVKNVTTIMTRNGEGICSCEIDEHASGCAWIYNLEVEEAHRCKGIGGVLLNEVEYLCSLHGVRRVSLSAKLGTFLIGWYERNGYRQICSDKDYVTMSKEL